MSFILDALKKSESERQRQIGPSLADVPVRRKKDEQPWWAFALAALLIVNLGVLLVVLLRSGGAADAKAIPATQPSTEYAAAPQTSVVPAADPRRAVTSPSNVPAANSAAVRSLAEEAVTAASDDMSAIQPDLAVAANVPAGPPIVRAIEPPTVAPLPSTPRNDSQPASDEILPTHGSLVAGGTRLPELRLDIHVYSPVPADRFVYVNMRKYTEGQPLSEGPAVERITSDGVVLNQQGLRFLLPRQ